MEEWIESSRRKPEKYDTVEIVYLSNGDRKSCTGYMGSNDKWYSDGTEIKGKVLCWKPMTQYYR